MILLLLLAQLTPEVDVVLASSNVFNPLTEETAVRRRDGAFFALDRFEQRVLLFLPGVAEGKVIARRGPGPGELEKANDLVYFDQTLYVLSAGHIQSFDREGTYLDKVRLPPGLRIQKTLGGWFGQGFSLKPGKRAFTLFDERLGSPLSLATWEQNTPSMVRIEPGKRTTVPVFQDNSESVVSRDGERVYYRLADRAEIQIYATNTREIIGSIPLEDRYPFDPERGAAVIARLQKNAPEATIRGDFPEYYPYTNGLFWGPEDHLLVRRWTGKNDVLLRFDRNGNPASPSMFDVDHLERIIAVDGDVFYISFQNEDEGDMGIAGVPRARARGFISTNPLE